jgi:hypothetical protein
VKKTTFLGNNEFSLGKGPKFPGEKATFPKEPYMFSRERPKFIEKTYVPNLFAITNVSKKNYIILQPTIGKVLRTSTIL